MTDATNNKPGPGMHEVLNAQLETFERAALLRRPAEAGELLLALIDRLRGGADFIGFTPDDPVKQKLYSRLASAIVTMLADPGFQFSTQGWAMFAINHPALQAIFESSVFDTAEHLVPALISNPEERDARKYQFDDARAMAKFLLTYCLNGQTDMNFDELFSKTAKTVLPLWIGMLAHHVCLHPLTHERRERLVDTGKYFDKITLPDGLLAPLSDAYMYCSYMTRPDKHRLKDAYGGLIRRMMAPLPGIPSKSEIAHRRETGLKVDRNSREIEQLLPRTAAHKPTILIPVEWFNSYHAMYRCYADAVMQLRPRFRLVAACKENILDPKARELFDDFLWLPDGDVALDKVIQRIGELAPDIIFYPSVGMALWWVACAQMRLAPIQIMGLGHPASSHSPEMDYVLADRGIAGEPSNYTERVLELPENSFRFIERSDTVVPEPYVRAHLTTPIRIAVPAMVVKLSVPFMQMCRNINSKSPRKLEWNFFPNVLGMWRFQAKRELDRWLPGAVIHHRYDYLQYMDVIAKCDLSFSTFPFGGTNSLVDSFLCGVPVICLERPGGHAHEICDAWAMRRVNMHELIADSVEHYEDRALHLIKYEVERDAYALQLRHTDIRSIFFGELQGPAKGAVLRAFEHVYTNHEEIQASDERVIPWEKQL